MFSCIASCSTWSKREDGDSRTNWNISFGFHAHSPGNKKNFSKWNSQVSYYAWTQAEKRCGAWICSFLKPLRPSREKKYGYKDSIRWAIVGRTLPPHMGFLSVKMAMAPKSFELSCDLIQLKSPEFRLGYERFSKSGKLRREARHQPALFRQNRPPYRSFCKAETSRGQNA